MKETITITQLSGPELDIKTVVATATLTDGKLEMTYGNSAFQRDLEGVGIYTPETKTVTPKDGEKFFQALKKAYVNSSRILVEIS